MIGFINPHLHVALQEC